MREFVFVHIGDTHLFENPRQADRLAALDRIIAENERRPFLAAWLHGGDVFHIRSTIETRNALRSRVRRMADSAPVVVTYGNHDVPGDLDIFGDIGARHPIHVVALPKVLRIALPSGLEKVHASIFALPYPTATGLVAQGVSQPDVPAAARAALEAVFADAGQRLNEARASGDIPIFLGHANLQGAVPSIGQPSIGAEIELDSGLFSHLGDCYKGLNHIHYAQAVYGAVYAGSICRLDWGEIEPKSYALVRYTRVDHRGWRYDWQPISVPVAPMYHVDGEMTRDGFTWKVTKGPDGPEMEAPPSWRGCEVRVRMRYRQREGLVLAAVRADVHAAFAEADRFEFEPQCVPDRGLRAPEVAAARTLPDKLAAWAAVAGVTLPAAAAAYTGRLEGTDPELLVREVEAEMAALLEQPPPSDGPGVDAADEQQYLFHKEAAQAAGKLQL
jgi:hypothetical protein